MKTPENSRLFTRWRNPSNGVESFVLTERVAPVQQSFYYTNPVMTDDCRFLWLACAYPPSGGRNVTPVLAVVDFERDELRVYHETQHRNHSAMVDPVTGDVYWTNEMELWKRGPHADDRPILLNRFPQELARSRRPDRIVTHLGFSANRKSVAIDARFGTECFIGDLPLDGSPFRPWQTFDGWFYDHGLFSPTDPDVQMFAHEFWLDHASEPFDGQRRYDRVWLIRRGEKAAPLLPQPLTHSGHEWWDASGAHVWLVHYGVGVLKIDLATRNIRNVWPGHLSHAHSDRSSRYLVADMMIDHANADCHVAFRDTQTGREVEIVNIPPLSKTAARVVHVHPHPQFCGGDRYLCHTTMVHDRIDVALVPTRELIDLTR